MCLGFFQEAYESARPWLPPSARVLELGCAEANWLHAMRVHRPDLHLTGIDWRGEGRPDADVLIQGDILTHEFAPASFDAIVAVSVVAWCGRGHYGDPEDDYGDRRLMQRCHRWLKPGGWMYMDCPSAFTESAATGFVTRNGMRFRAYTNDGIQTRVLQGLWSVRQRWVFGHDVSLHSDGPYVAMLVDPVKG